MFPFQRVLNNHSWAKPVPAVASSMTIMLQSDNRALARQTSCLWPTLRIVSQCWLYVTVTAETWKSVKQKRCGIFILRFSYLIFSPLSWISKSNLFSCSDMNSLRLALSNAPQSCPSLYSANGSMFSRSVPVKRIGSWGGIQWVLTLWKLEHSWTSQCSRPPAMSPQYPRPFSSSKLAFLLLYVNSNTADFWIPFFPPDPKAVVWGICFLTESATCEIYWAKK